MSDRASGEGVNAPGALTPESVLYVDTLSDWHVGSGTRVPGRVNAVVRRDGDGIPYLPGTTLTGVLRDACLTVARALDDAADDGPWQRWHRVLFGDQAAAAGGRAGRRLGPATIGIGPARLSPGLRSQVVGDAALAAETTFVKPGVRIDPQTGRAADDMLRFVEMARAGLPLQADVRIHLPTPDGLGAPGAQRGPRPADDQVTPMWQAATALLVLGAAWCDRIGGDRRRGAGNVALRWADQDPPGWAEWLAQTDWIPAQARASLAPSGGAPGIPAITSGPGWSSRAMTGRRADATGAGSLSAGEVTLGLRLACLTPVRVPRQVVGNIVLGHDHIPGAVLLAWLSSRWGEDVVREAVAVGGILVRHAYPEINGRRGVPAPFSLFRVRRTGDVVNAAVETLPSEPARQVRDRWTLPDLVDGKVVLREQPRVEATHNAISRATQRPDSAAGLYAVEVLPAGTRLRANILVGAALAERLTGTFGARWWELLVGHSRMGSRRHGEYGLADVTVEEPGSGGLQPPTRPVPEHGRAFCVWAVSDLVVRGPSLRLAADPADVLGALTTRLDGGGLRLDWASEGSGVTCAARTRRRDSWHGRWQLPRDSIVGVAAGSVLVLRVTDGTIDPNAWTDLAARGLGERRMEGFGEVLLDAPVLQAGLLPAVAQLPTQPAATPGAGGSQAHRSVVNERDEDGGLTEAEREGLRLLRRRAVVTACRDRVIVLRRDGSAPAGYTKLRAALAALSPSQRSTWLTLVNDAALRRTDSRLRQEIERWLRHQGQARQGQRGVAERLRVLVDGDMDALVGLGALDAISRLEALTVLVDDLVDELRRPRATLGGRNA